MKIYYMRPTEESQRVSAGGSVQEAARMQALGFPQESYGSRAYPARRRRSRKSFSFILFALSLAAFMFFLIACFFVHTVAYAAGGGIDPVYKYAWSENLGWLNFNATSSNVLVTDSKLIGPVWSENTGWVSLNPSDTVYVHNDGQGNLSGYAWGEGIGYIDFAGVTIDSEGYFHGYANSTNAGKISFNCLNTNTCGTSNFKTKTYWHPTPVSVPPSGPSGPSGGGGGGCISNCGGSTTTPPITLPVITPTSLVPQSGPISPLLLSQAASSAYGKACQLVDSYLPPLLTQDSSFGTLEASVVDLQKFLNTNGYVVSYVGPGAYGKETLRFGGMTKDALAKFQKANGLQSELGRLGPKSRAFINAMVKKKTPAKAAICNVDMCPVYLDEYIKLGANNNPVQVSKLKSFLGTYEGFKGLPNTAVYDKATFGATVAFQERYSSEILGPWSASAGTGWVYKTTKREINQLYCQYQYEKLTGLRK